MDLDPAIRAGLSPCCDVAAALEWARALASNHYENFPVVSILVPRELRQDFCNIYAYCRVADDLADEVPDAEQSLRLLAALREEIVGVYAGRPSTRLGVALSQTLDRHAIPTAPLMDLLSAFEQDQRVRRYETFDQLLDYCRRSADPVGRLVLYVCGYEDADRQRLSDRICTALQLANFWQDVRRDLLERDRIYIPAESMRRFGVDEAQLRAGRCDENYRAMIRFEVDRTQGLFDEGAELLKMLRAGVRHHVGLFGRGGAAILDAIRREGYDTLSRRPVLSAMQKSRLIACAVVAAGLGRIGRIGRAGGSASRSRPAPG